MSLRHCSGVGARLLACGWLAVAGACGSTPPPAKPTPEGPLAPIGRWAAGVTTYRYNRTLVTTATDGKTSITHEVGAVVRPDRQHLQLQPAAAAREAGREMIVLGRSAWIREVALGSIWTVSEVPEAPLDPLTIVSKTMASAKTPAEATDQREDQDRVCRGWHYEFDPTSLVGWMVAQRGEATVFVDEKGDICRVVVRLEGPGVATGEMVATIRDVGEPMVIEAPLP